MAGLEVSYGWDLIHFGFNLLGKEGIKGRGIGGRIIRAEESAWLFEREEKSGRCGVSGLLN